MKSIKTFGVIAALGLGLLACGGDSEPAPRSMGGEATPEMQRAVREAAAPAPSAPPADNAAAAAKLSEYLVWPEDGGPHDSLEDDIGECNEMIANDPNRRHRLHPLQEVARLVECLMEKGWVSTSSN